MYGKRITKTIEVTITVDEHGEVRFDYHEPESGDSYRIETYLHRMEEDESGRVGTEIMSWVPLMADELSDESDGQDFEVGDILKINDGMTLRVVEVRGNWMKCDYLAPDGTWKPRGRTEGRETMRKLVSDGILCVERA